MKALFRVAGIVLAAMFLVSVVVSASASAAHWLVCLKENSGTITKWESSQCEKAKASGGWEWSELKGTEAAKIVSQTLELTDTDVLLVGSSTVICKSGSGEGTGAVGPGKYGRINTTKVKEPKENCRGGGGCKEKGVEEVKAIHTPWQTELVETEGKVLAVISGSGSGEPGWEVRCEDTLNEKITDICEKEGEKVLLSNVATGTELLVLGTFEKAVKAHCELGGAESGEVGGSVAILLVGGAGLRAVVK